ncbi:cytochrome c oxidase subunit 7A1, mitochondrial-like isoform X2 [Eriocheir sinensis]|nr:cytochrome c oxidase subunit 7A1, mitochondrial-like isoform X2 [Eriocheir sinensis]
MQFVVATRIAGTDPPAHRGRYAPVPPRLLSKMKLFQVPNGLPVHIKGGPMDKIMFAITSAVCLVGFVECFHVWYTLSYPPAPKSD